MNGFEVSLIDEQEQLGLELSGLIKGSVKQILFHNRVKKKLYFKIMLTVITISY